MSDVLTVLQFALGAVRLLFEGIGAYTTALVALDEVWWTNRRHWRYVGAGVLALVMLGVVNLPVE